MMKSKISCLSFGAPLVVSVLSGWKTVTRRKIIVQPVDDNCTISEIVDCPKKSLIGKWCYNQGSKYGDKFFSSPYRAGDRIKVREPVKAIRIDGVPYIIYTSDNARRRMDKSPEDMRAWENAFNYRGGESLTIPAMHMRESLSRIILKVTEVYPDRVKNITEEEAKLEGVLPWEVGQSSKDAFLEVMKCASGDDFVNNNGFVWVIHFKKELVEKF